jgi:L-lactate utilization protein LutC
VSARDDILGRVRSALGEHPAYDPTGSAGDARGSPVTVASADSSVTVAPAPADAALLDLFVERVADYRAVVVRCGWDEVAGAVREALGSSAKVVVPEGFPEELLALPAGAELVVDDGLSAAALDRVDAVVTTARVGIATTGTIVLDHGPGQGRRALSLVPDRHVCVVASGQVVETVTEAVARLDASRPLTWISGPSATSDIELDRVEGVHGPRILHVIVVGWRSNDWGSPERDQ